MKTERREDARVMSASATTTAYLVDDSVARSDRLDASTDHVGIVGGREGTDEAKTLCDLHAMEMLGMGRSVAGSRSGPTGDYC